jgi:hypothetical protein
LVKQVDVDAAKQLLKTVFTHVIPEGISRLPLMAFLQTLLEKSSHFETGEIEWLDADARTGICRTVNSLVGGT